MPLPCHLARSAGVGKSEAKKHRSWYIPIALQVFTCWCAKTAAAPFDRRCYAATDAGKGLMLSESIAESLKKTMRINWSAVETMKSAHPLYINTTLKHDGAIFPERKRSLRNHVRMRARFSLSGTFSSLLNSKVGSPRYQRNTIDRGTLSVLRTKFSRNEHDGDTGVIFYQRIWNKGLSPQSTPCERRCTTVAEVSRQPVPAGRLRAAVIEDLRAEPSAADLTGWNARGGNQPGSESGSDARCSAGSKAIQGKRPHTTRSSFLRAVEASPRLLQSMYVYYPSSLRWRSVLRTQAPRPRYPARILRYATCKIRADSSQSLLEHLFQGLSVYKPLTRNLISEWIRGVSGSHVKI